MGCTAWERRWFIKMSLLLRKTDEEKRIPEKCYQDVALSGLMSAGNRKLLYMFQGFGEA
jgi:hypothetical protein